MTKIGAYEAKTHLASLLDRVARGERITITKHGVAVAELVPPTGARRHPLIETIASLRAFRLGKHLGPAVISDSLMGAGRS